MDMFFCHEDFDDTPNNNIGSAVVEVTLLMPVLIFIIISIVFLFMDIINDAVIQGESYCGMYGISVGDSKEILLKKIRDCADEKIIGSGNSPDVSIEFISGEMTVSIDLNNLTGGNIYIYQGEDAEYKREYDKCTDRLRRWQLYGDKLRE